MTSTSKIEEFVLEYICEYPKEPLFRGACEKVEELIREQRQKFIDELALYLMDIHNGVTAEDARMVEHFLNTTGESDE